MSKINIKKLSSVLLVMALASLVLIGAGAADGSGTCGDGLTWSVVNNELTITYDGVGTGVMDDYTSATPAPWGTNIITLSLPEGIKNIGNNAFYYCNKLTGNLIIPSTVTSIGDSSFEWCKGFTGNLTLPSSVISIGDSAFNGCSGFTGSLTIPSSVSSIGDRAFDGCSGFTGSLTIHSGVTSIGSFAFNGCSGLSSITLPSSITTIDYMAFFGLSYNSIIYTTGDISLLLGKYSTNQTALAKDNGDKSFTFTVAASSFTSGFPLTSSNAPVKSGYEFDGWYDNAQYSGEKKTTVSNGQTLYAKWSTTPGYPDTLHLRAGWNFISVPMTLDSSMKTASTFFSEVDMDGHGVFAYNGETQNWIQLSANSELKPLEGYWVYSKTDFVGTKKIVFDTKSMSVGNTKKIYEGWNAVGLNIDVSDGTNTLSAKSTFAGLDWNRYFEKYTTGSWKVIVNGGSSTECEENPVYAGSGGWLYANAKGILVGNAP